MRPRGIPTTLLLALTLLAVPSASAGGAGDAPAFRCAYLYEDIHGPYGVTSVEGEYTCWFNVVVNEGIDCGGGDVVRTEDQVLNVNVVRYECADGVATGSIPTAATAQWLPVCPHHGGSFGALGEVAYRECEVQVHLVDDMVCTKLGLVPVRHDVVDEGSVHVTYATCAPPIRSDAPTGGPCDRIHNPVIGTEELTWTVDERCRHDVYVDVIECPNEAQWTKTNEVYEAHPNLTLHYTFCRLG